MNFSSSTRICVVPRTKGVGGMVSFQGRLVQGLRRRGIEVCFDLSDLPYQAVLVIGGTRHLVGLWQARRRGIPIVQRLDGMNWLHRLGGIGKVGLRYYLRAEYGNMLLALIRSRIASHIVYQSQFVRHWWERVHGRSPVPSSVIYNGVDLDTYTPEGHQQRPNDRIRLLMVEGNLMGGYEQGLNIAAEFAQALVTAQGMSPNRKVELMVVGRVAKEVQQAWTDHWTRKGNSEKAQLTFAGLVPGDQIPFLCRSAHLFYSSDVNHACPNSVIEALACGLPVVAFDTGALPELVSGDAGRIVPYGGDPWRLDPPDVQGLVRAGLEILAQEEHFRLEARKRAEAAFGLESMLEAYRNVLLKP